MRTISTKLKAWLILAVVWVFIGMYFFDAANIDDDLPNTIVIHPEADDSSPDASSLGFYGEEEAAHKAQSGSHQNQQSPVRQTSKILIDQDSPSLAAEPLLSMVSSRPFHGNSILVVDSFTPSSSLYLLNCTLLI